MCNVKELLKIKVEFETGMFGYQIIKGETWMINLHWLLRWI